MRNFIFAGLVASIFLMPALAQENLVSNSGSAASAGVVSEVGVSFGGVSVASLALATALITALLAFMVEDNIAATTSTSATN
jgi:Predicted ATP-dependent protease